MTFNKSGLQVRDLSELETLGVLDAAIETASLRRQAALATISQDEAGTVHGGASLLTIGGIISVPGTVAGFFPVCYKDGYCM